MRHITRCLQPLLAFAAAMVVLVTAPAALALQITTDWYEDPTRPAGPARHAGDRRCRAQQ
ncbi:MAG: hypothetical protein WBL23_07375 [Salinisphaera sp.]|uniref:hypothetical protein n=1 Tax=Salinisphaera sp. TaxID=1914330 RepID=UPI003C7AA1FA